MAAGRVIFLVGVRRFALLSECATTMAAPVPLMRFNRLAPDSARALI
jgi:hypothetical protein